MHANRLRGDTRGSVAPWRRTQAQPTFITQEQEQELYGTYDPEAPPILLKDDLQSLSDSVSHGTSQWRDSATMLITKPTPVSQAVGGGGIGGGGGATPSLAGSTKLEPNRRVPDTIPETDENSLRSERAFRTHQARKGRTMSHFVHNFRSPIDFRRADGR